MSETTVRKKVTIEDVAAEVGVTKGMVSQVLANKGRASQSTREAIWKAAREMNYEPNPLAQRLFSGRSDKTVALFTLSLDLNVNTRKLQYLHSLLLSAGYEVPIYASGYRSHDTEQAQLVKTLCLQRPRAIIVNAGGVVPETLERLERYRQEGGLVVSYDLDIDLECDKVVFDREENTYLVIRHLLELGHRHIALGQPLDMMGEGRARGCRRAFAEFGAEPRLESLREQECWQDSFIESELFRYSYEDWGVGMARRFLELSPRPTAVCLLDDYTSTGFAAELMRHGVRVPEDVSIVSHDDSPIARCGHLQLTTASHPVEEICSAAIDLLQKRLEAPHEPWRRVVVSGELMVRNSAIAVAPS